jgi:hypothetical protein
MDCELAQAAVPLINYMVKSPNDFKTLILTNGQTPLQMMFSLIAKIFQEGKEMEDEMHSMVAVNLIMALLEHLGEGLSEQIHVINGFYLSELSAATTSDYKNMIIQGIMMNISYDQNASIQSLKAHQALDQVFDFILENIQGMEKDFEIKRLVIGLSALTLSPEAANLDPSV